MLEIGDLIDGKYRIVRQLGQGGMGEVYEALHEGIGKPVAVKVLRPQDAPEGELVARFHREAQAAASAGHRGIVDIYDVGTADDGSPFLVMELLQGESLADRLDRRGRLDLPEAAYVVCQVLSALSAAHDVGVVHRDLKPENVFLVESGAALPEVKLLDFGISRVIVPGTVTRMTRSGAVMGTPAYMSPEQAAGKSDIDHRTDLFSIGVMLQECLTGRLPFDGDNYNALIAAIISTEPPRPGELRPELPHEIDDLVHRALRKDREARHQSAAELFAELRPFVDPGAVASLRTPIGLQGSPPDTARQSPEAAPARTKALPDTVAAPGAELPALDEKPRSKGGPHPESPPPDVEPAPPAEAGPADQDPLPGAPDSGPSRPRLGALIFGLVLVVVVGGVAAGLLASSLSRGSGTVEMSIPMGDEDPRGTAVPAKAPAVETDASPAEPLASPGELDAGPEPNGRKATTPRGRTKGGKIAPPPADQGGDAEAGPRRSRDYGDELEKRPRPNGSVRPRPRPAPAPPPPAGTGSGDYGEELDL